MSKKKKKGKAKTYSEDQIHPQAKTGKEVIPDTLDHATSSEFDRAPGCGESVYLPGDGFLISHGGFSSKSKASVYDQKVREIREKAGNLKKKYALPQGGTYLSEEEILKYAAVIRKYREMSGAKGAKEVFFENARARQHEGTDAFDDAKSGFHRQSDEFNIDKSRSTIGIRLSSCGPPGMPLNGSKIYHHHVVTIELSTPDGRQLCTVHCSPEQFASALFSNSDVPCTLGRYWSISDDDIMLTERVRPPQSIRKRMEKRLKHRLKEQTGKVHEIVEELAAQAESNKPMRKTQLRDLAERLSRAMDHSAANAAFTVDQAREEITGIMESAAIQFIGQQSLDAKTLWEAAGPALGYDGDTKAIEMHEEDEAE